MIHIAFATDAAYLPHASAMMSSAASTNNPAKLSFHCLHPNDLGIEKLDALRRFADQIGVALNTYGFHHEELSHLPTMGRITQVMWYRIFLPERLARCDRVLYLDCDTLVMDSLDALWSTDLGECWVGAVRNVFEREARPDLRRLGLSDPREYFNSGVLLINLSAWRREGCTSKLMELASNHEAGLVWPDQDALNTVFRSRWFALHPRWNCQNSFYFFPEASRAFSNESLKEATSIPGILHFEGGELAKPWHYLCGHPYRGIYFEHRRRSPWPEVAVEGKNALNRLLKVLVPSRLIIPSFVISKKIERALRLNIRKAFKLFRTRSDLSQNL